MQLIRAEIGVECEHGQFETRAATPTLKPSLEGENVEPAAAFGKAVRARRKAANMSQEKLALQAGLERVFVSWLENGRKQPTFQTMLKLANALNCFAADLVAEAESFLVEDNPEQTS